MINNVVLVGRLTKEPELRYTSNGVAVAGFTLAINRQFKNQAGEREADFIRCVIWRQSAENIASWAKKGALIGVTGRIQTGSYDNSQGQKVFTTDVLVESFQMLESKTSRNNQDNHNQQINFGQKQTTSNYKNDNPFGTQPVDISDDDLPF